MISPIEYALHKIRRPSLSFETSLVDLADKVPRLRGQYDYYHNYFWHLAPAWLRDHREFFRKDHRSFAEDAHYALWFLLFKEIAPASFLEIGVYRGCTLSLARALSNSLMLDCEILGVSPFSRLGDSVSAYRDFDYYEDTLSLSKRCGAPIRPHELCVSISSAPNAADAISSRAWDLIFIDGGHDYATIRADFDLCSQHVAPGGHIALDDAALYTSYSPRTYSFKGHPGPSLVLKEALESGYVKYAQCGHLVVLRDPRDLS